MKSNYISGVPYKENHKRKKKWLKFLIAGLILLLLCLAFLLSGYKFSKEKAVDIFNGVHKMEGPAVPFLTDKLPGDIFLYTIGEGTYFGAVKLQKLPKLPLWKVETGDIEKINKAYAFDTKSDFTKIGIRIIPVTDDEIAYIALSKIETSGMVRLDEIATERNDYRYTAVESGFAIFEEKKGEDLAEYQNILAFSKDNRLLYYKNGGGDIMDIKKTPAEKPKENIQIKKQDWEVAMENKNGFILPQSDEKVYTHLEIEAMKLSQDAIQMAIWELYARHGKIFEEGETKAYFEAKEWYEPDKKYRSYLNKTEKINEKTLKYFRGTQDLPQILAEDLNGDAIKDNIVYTENTLSFTLTINENKIRGEGQNFMPEIRVVDLNASDDYKEVMLKEILEEGRARYHFYRFNGHEIISIGSIESLYDDLKIGDGEFKVTKRAFFIDWFQYEASYALNEAMVFYEKKSAAYPINQRYRTGKSFYLYEEKSLDASQKVLVYEAERIRIKEGDLSRWAYVEKSNGEGGYIYVDEKGFLNQSAFKTWQVFER